MCGLDKKGYQGSWGGPWRSEGEGSGGAGGLEETSGLGDAETARDPIAK